MTTGNSILLLTLLFLFLFFFSSSFSLSLSLGCPRRDLKKTGIEKRETKNKSDINKVYTSGLQHEFHTGRCLSGNHTSFLSARRPLTKLQDILNDGFCCSLLILNARQTRREQAPPIRVKFQFMVLMGRLWTTAILGLGRTFQTVLLSERQANPV